MAASPENSTSVVAWQEDACWRVPADPASRHAWREALERYLYLADDDARAPAALASLEPFLAGDEGIGRALLSITRATVLGRWRDVRNLCAPVLSRPPPDPDVRFLWVAISAFCAALRLGDAAEERAYELLALRTGETLGTQVAAAAVEIETLGRLMGRGFYWHVRATLETLPLRNPDARRLLRADPHWASRVSSILGTCLQGLGDYAASLETLRAMETGFARSRPRALLYSWVRRTLSLAVEREDLAAAREVLALHEEEIRTSAYQITYTLLLQEKVRMALLDEGRAEIRDLLARLEAHVSAQGLARTFLSLTEVRLELDLRRDRPAEAEARVAGELSDTVRRGDLGGQCVCYLMLSRVSVLRRDLRAARAHVATSLAIAEEHGFRKSIVRGLLCRAGIAFLQGDDAGCVEDLRAALAAAEDLGLPIQALCARAALALVERGDFGGPTLRALALAPSGLPETLHSLRFYGFLEDVDVIEDAPGARRRHPMETAFRSFRAVRRVVAFPAEGFVAAFEPRGAALVDLHGGDAVSVLLRNLLEQEPFGLGLAAAEIHALSYPRVAFREDVHRGRVRALLARCRKRLEGTPLSIVHDAAGRRYVLSCEGPFSRARLQVTAPRPARAEASPREKEILEFLRGRGRATTAELRAAFRCTRQTLHPMLKRLETLGLVALRRRGPISAYVVTQRAPS